MCVALFAIFYGVFLGSATVETLHYQKCKRDNFQSEHCAFEKKLSKLDKDLKIEEPKKEEVKVSEPVVEKPIVKAPQKNRIRKGSSENHKAHCR